MTDGLQLWPSVHRCFLSSAKAHLGLTVRSQLPTSASHCLSSMFDRGLQRVGVLQEGNSMTGGKDGLKQEQGRFGHCWYQVTRLFLENVNFLDLLLLLISLGLRVGLFLTTHLAYLHQCFQMCNSHRA